MSSLSQFFGSGPIATTWYTSGSGTHTFNAATKSVKYIITGPGGNGGSADNVSADYGAGSGGSAGGTIIDIINLAPGVTSWVYSVGTGSPSYQQTTLNGWGAPAGMAGNPGGPTGIGGAAQPPRSLYFSNNTIAPSSDIVGTTFRAGGLGGKGGDTLVAGSRGGMGALIAQSTAQSFTSGAAAGTIGTGNGAGGGGGGTSYWGIGGAGGNGGTSPQNGVAAPNYGAGGGGAGGGQTGSPARVGGTGGSGVVLIIEYPYYQ